jgi:hypothetical protein
MEWAWGRCVKLLMDRTDQIPSLTHHLSPFSSAMEGVCSVQVHAHDKHAFQGVASALVADLVPEHFRGTAYGIFNTDSPRHSSVSCKVLCGTFMGLVWPSCTFSCWAGLAVMAAPPRIRFSTH